MKIIVNGAQQEVTETITVRQLIESMGLKGACAAEVNQTLVPWREQEIRTLLAGDQVELVTLVGGG